MRSETARSPESTKNNEGSSQMSKTILFITTALAMSGAAAMAAPTVTGHLPNGAHISREANGQIVGRIDATGRKAGQPGYVPVNTSSVASLWSKEKNAPFIPYYATVAGCFSGTSCYEDAIAFTPAASVTSKSVTLGLMAFAPSAYTYQADVSIYSDAGGVPGTALATKTVSAPTVFGTLGAPVTAKLKVSLTAGTQYWVVVAGHSSTDLLAWGFEDADFVNAPLSAQNYGSGWNTFNTVQAPGYLLK
jgi:hypothetical protein